MNVTPEIGHVVAAPSLLPETTTLLNVVSVENRSPFVNVFPLTVAFVSVSPPLPSSTSCHPGASSGAPGFSVGSWL